MSSFGSATNGNKQHNDDDEKRLRRSADHNEATVSPESKKLSSAKLSKFRTAKCLKKFNHVWKDCDFSHARNMRRDTSLLPYSPILCPHFSYDQEVLQQCLHGINCQFCHSKEEVNYHPLRYKTTQCRTVTTNEICEREFCPYWHSSLDRNTMTEEAEHLILILLGFLAPENSILTREKIANSRFLSSPVNIINFIEEDANDIIKDWSNTVFDQMSNSLCPVQDGLWNPSTVSEFLESRYYQLIRYLDSMEVGGADIDEGHHHHQQHALLQPDTPPSFIATPPPNFIATTMDDTVVANPIPPPRLSGYLNHGDCRDDPLRIADFFTEEIFRPTDPDSFASSRRSSHMYSNLAPVMVTPSRKSSVCSFNAPLVPPGFIKGRRYSHLSGPQQNEMDYFINSHFDDHRGAPGIPGVPFIFDNSVEARRGSNCSGTSPLIPYMPNEIPQLSVNPPMPDHNSLPSFLSPQFAGYPPPKSGGGNPQYARPISSYRSSICEGSIKR